MADPYAPATGNSLYSDFSGTGSRQQFPWEDITKGMTQDQYWNFIGTLAGARPSGFDPGPLPVVSSDNLFPITQGYDPNTGFDYTNQYGGADNVFVPKDVYVQPVDAASQLLAENQALKERLAAEQASKPGIGSQIGYGLLGMATGVPGGLIRAGVNAIGGLNSQGVMEGGVLPAYYTSGAPTGFVDAEGFSINPDTGLRYDASMLGGGGTAGGGGAVTQAGTTATSTATSTATTTATTTATSGVTMVDPFQVKDSSLPSVALGGSLTGGAGGVGGLTGGGDIVPADKFVVSDTKIKDSYDVARYNWILQQSGYVFDPATGKWVMPKMTVKPDTSGTTTTTSIKTTQTDPFALLRGFKDTGMGPFAAPANSTKTPSTSTSSTTATTTSTNINLNVGATGGTDLGLGSLVGQATNVGTGTARNFPAELAASTAALRANQPNIMGMYGSIYQNLLSQTAIPQAANQSLAQMQADAAKLQRIQQGYLSSEDVRQSQQAAREAYGARGQVMGPGAIGAEILNREAIRQQREDQARAGYQASMGNVFNAAQLQTGNIFSPIGNLVSGTFNPLGAYPQDVYSSNVNAQLARDISAANNAAAIEAAKYGATAQKNAALTSAGTSLLSKLLFG